MGPEGQYTQAGSECESEFEVECDRAAAVMSSDYALDCTYLLKMTFKYASMLAMFMMFFPKGIQYGAERTMSSKSILPKATENLNKENMP